MPTYQYQCKYCGHELEEFQSITEPPLTLCPQCKTENLARVMGIGGGLIFKGSGFYLTDYKNVKSGGTPTPKASPPPHTPQEPKDTSGKKEKP
jgi:putative FmdB family regulatory protein